MGTYCIALQIVSPTMMMLIETPTVRLRAISTISLCRVMYVLIFILLGLTLILVLVLYLTTQHTITRINNALLSLLYSHRFFSDKLPFPPYSDNSSPLLGPGAVGVTGDNFEPDNLTRFPAVIDVKHSGVALCFGYLCFDKDFVVHVARSVPV